MQRISVVGTSGSGKTTLARQLAQRLGYPHIELDTRHCLPARNMPTCKRCVSVHPNKRGPG